MVRSRISPAPGSGIGLSTSRKFAAVGAPRGRDAKSTWVFLSLAMVVPLARRSLDVLVEGGGKSRSVARRAVEGRLQPAAMIAPHEIAISLDRVEAAPRAFEAEPALAGGDMLDLFAIDRLERGDARCVLLAAELFDHLRRHIEAAGLEHQWHDREARQEIMRGPLCRLPQSVMCRQVAIRRAERCEPRRHQRVMRRLLARDRDPIVEE